MTSARFMWLPILVTLAVVLIYIIAPRIYESIPKYLLVSSCEAKFGSDWHNIKEYKQLYVFCVNDKGEIRYLRAEIQN